VPDDWPENEAFLLNAFKQRDSDMSGYLYPNEILEVFDRKVRLATNDDRHLA
jgi:hypothetical protein